MVKTKYLALHFHHRRARPVPWFCTLRRPFTLIAGRMYLRIGRF